MRQQPPVLFATSTYSLVRDGENLLVRFARFPVSACNQFFQLTALNSAARWRKFLRPVTPKAYRWGLYGLSYGDLQHLATQLMWAPLPPATLDQVQLLVLNLGRVTNWPVSRICALSYPDLYHIGEILELLPPTAPNSVAVEPEIPTPEQRQAALQRTYQVLRQLDIDPKTGQRFSDLD